ncbi:hypothetical protein ElyMa_002403800 [Elysia marginata]|uniref:Uncharacterized protein n=1 Tax=Elysia marginata TaxID=1093978 RepID=A0AAV4GFQ0_9GAST|nr:hypothetical protein ElyMa_002403800 [Elysia marginata]
MPVKFREVHFDPKYVDNQVKNEIHRDQILTKSGPKILPLTEHVFFKDPLCPPDVAAYDREDSESDLLTPMKLGRNMRASHAQLGTRRKKGVSDLMNEKKRLLHQQKQQQAEVSREADSEQLAAVLVNDMMQHGFHITPPEHTPRGDCPTSSNLPSHAPPSSSETENKDGESRQRVLPDVEEKRLVLAIHREVKRVTGTEVMDIPS